MGKSSKVQAGAMKPGKPFPDSASAVPSKLVDIDQILVDLLEACDANPLFPDEESREMAKAAIRSGFASES